MNSVPLAEHMRHIRANDWKTLAEILATSAHKLAQAGADFAICPDNTYHQAFAHLIPQSPLPWLHIAEAVAEEADRLGGVHSLGYLLCSAYCVGGGSCSTKVMTAYELPESCPLPGRCTRAGAPHRLAILIPCHRRSSDSTRA